MNTLWVFGDSFSWDHKIRFKIKPERKNNNDQVWLYIKEHLNGEVFDSWGEILSRNLNLQYQNHACFQTGITLEHLNSGNSNDSALNLLNHFCSDFKKGDIVLFGFTDVTRFDWAVSEDYIKTFHVADEEELVRKKTIEDILINRDEYSFTRYDFLQKLKSIEALSDLVGFDLWYWDWSGTFTDYVSEGRIPNDRWIFYHAHPNYRNYGWMIWEDYKAGPICWETDYKNPDSHYGKVGNQIHAEVLTNFLKKNR